MFYSQKSYPKTKLGSCSDTIYSSGCLLVSICNLFPRISKGFKMNPEELNQVCIKSGLYVNGCMLDLASLAKTRFLTYKKTTTKPEVICIAETDHWKSKGVPQHFFMIKPDGTIVDSLDKAPNWKPNPYNIVSYRVFTPKSTKSSTNPKKCDVCGKLY